MNLADVAGLKGIWRGILCPRRLQRQIEEWHEGLVHWPGGMLAVQPEGGHEELAGELRALEEEILQREQFFSSILRNSADAIITMDPEERVTSWNKGAEAIFGYSEGEMLGKSLAVLMPKDLKLQNELERISEVARAHGYIRSYQTQRVTKEGQLIDIIFTRTTIKDNQGNVMGFSSVVKDVTEQKLLARHLAQMEKLSAIGEVAAGLAHEIKNPLAGIRGAIEVIREEMSQTAPHRMILGEVLSEVSRIDRIVNNLLSYSKPKAPDFVKTDLRSLLENIIALLRNVADAKRARIELEAPAELPTLVGDENDLKQLFMNLLLNGLDAIADEGIIRVIVQYASDQRMHISVEDNGCGIAADKINRIFHPFFTTKKQGTGLGLATCKRIANDHGGEISVSSQLGIGTRFSIQIPLNPVFPMSLADDVTG